MLPSDELLPRANAFRQTYALVPLAGTTSRAFVQISIIDGSGSDRSRRGSSHHSCSFAFFPLPLAGNDVLQLVSPFLWSAPISVISWVVASQP